MDSICFSIEWFSTTQGVNGHFVIVTTESDVISHSPKGIYSPGDFLKATKETWSHFQKTDIGERQ